MHFPHNVSLVRICVCVCVCVCVEFIELPRAPKNLRMFPDLSTFFMTLEWDTFKVQPDDIIVEMKAEDESEFRHVAKLKGKTTQVVIENIDKTKRYSFRVTGRNESGAGETATVELTEPLYREPPKVEKTEEVKTKEEVEVKTEIIREEVTEVTETGQYLLLLFLYI